MLECITVMMITTTTTTTTIIIIIVIITIVIIIIIIIIIIIMGSMCCLKHQRWSMHLHQQDTLGLLAFAIYMRFEIAKLCNPHFKCKSIAKFLVE